jgi:very-short-patch-repair endonuclease
MYRYNKKLKPLARALRKNMTDAEKLLWSRVSRKQFPGYQFYRQRTIGNYIVDFYCHAAGLVVEIGGGRHYYGKGQDSDKARDVYLADLGLKVLRFSDIDIMQNIDGVLEQLFIHLNPPESPFTKGGK